MGISSRHTLNVTASNFPVVIFCCPDTQERGSPGLEVSWSCPCPTPPLPLIRGSLCSFFLLLLLVQTQSLLDWRRHCHGFGELRSSSAQVEAEFPAVTFITIIVMKHWLFSLFFWQSSAGAAEVCCSALISVISRSPYCMT